MSQSEVKSFQFEDLPTEVLIEIFDRVDNEGLEKIAKTNQRFDL